jgi:large subunit ribosomal protein L31
MKGDIHPTYYPNARATCACGATYTVGSTRKEIRVEICAACHPFYTGVEKIVDTAGRVEKFERRRAAAQPVAVALKRAREDGKKESKRVEKEARGARQARGAGLRTRNTKK